MRRTPREDIEFVGGFIHRDRENRLLQIGDRYFNKDSMSLELHNILISMGVGGLSVNHSSFVASDETYLKALDILKIIIEEGVDGE